MHSKLSPSLEKMDFRKLKAELLSYVVKTDDISNELGALEWWKLNAVA